MVSVCIIEMSACYSQGLSGYVHLYDAVDSFLITESQYLSA